MDAIPVLLLTTINNLQIWEAYVYLQIKTNENISI